MDFTNFGAIQLFFVIILLFENTLVVAFLPSKSSGKRFQSYNFKNSKLGTFHVSTLPILRASPDDLRFAAQFQPTQAAVCGSILVAFYFIQTRINRANKILNEIGRNKKTLQTLKMNILNGDKEAITLKQDLENQMLDLETELISVMTFISIPGSNINLRFRVNRPDLIPNENTTEQAIIENEQSNNEVQKNAVSAFNDKNISPESVDVDNNQKLTVQQKVLIPVGVVIVVSLTLLLNLLINDPVGLSAVSSGSGIITFPGKGI